MHKIIAKLKLAKKDPSRFAKIISNLVFLNFLFVFLANSAAATQYYVDNVNGSDTNSGTSPSAAWKTIAAVNSKMSQLVPGDIVSFKRGGTWTDLLTISKSGVSGNPITFNAYGTGNSPIIQHPHTDPGEKMCIKITSDYTIVDGFVLTYTSMDGSGVYIAGGADHNIVRNCEIYNVCIGLDINGQYNLITGNYIHDLDMDPNAGWGATGVMVKNTDNELSYNRLENCRHISNMFKWDGGAFEIYGDGSRSYIHHNWAYRNVGFLEVGAYSPVTVGDIRVEYNITIDNGRITGIHNSGAEYIIPNNFRVQNNTFVETDKSDYFDKFAYISFSSGGTSGQYFFRNNILYLDGWYQIALNWTTFDHDHNLFYLINGTKLNINLDATDIAGTNPNFVNVATGDLHIQSSSPARDKGIHLGYPGAVDFDGNTVPFGPGPDIGAYEYVGAGAPLSASTGASPTSGQVPLTVNFTGSASGGTSPYSYSWTFGDGGSSTSQNPSHTYSSAGNYAASLTVTDNTSAKASSTVNITVSATPAPLTANIVASPTAGTAPLTVNFSGSATGGSSPYTYRWNFGDGGSSTAQNPSHTYSSAGTYAAALTVTDSQNATNSKSLTITVTATPSQLVATASASPTSGQAPLTVSFSGSATGGTSPYSYKWTFGDGGSSTSQNPSHTYSSAGIYTAALTVTDSQNTTSNKSLTITVTATPAQLAATASANPTSGTAPLIVNFSGSAAGGTSPYSYSWSFGDGGSSTSQNPSHTYSSAGTYIAALTVTDSTSAKANASVSIAVGTVITAANLSLAAETGAPAPGSGGTTDPTPGNHTFSVGSTISVKSIPNTDYRFSKWAGDIKESTMFSLTTDLIMDKNRSISATFCTKCADVNGDLKITPGDAQATFDIYLGRINPTWCELENADVNCNGSGLEPKITPADAQMIFNKFLKKGEVTSDCSGASRAAALSNPVRIDSLSKVSLTINEVAFVPGQDILVPIIVESPSEITAFGFDLSFPANVLSFINLESTELTNGYDQLDANVLSYQAGNQEKAGAEPARTHILRVGGYKTNSTQNPPSGVLVTLVFRVTGETDDPDPISVVATYDDIQNASIRNGMINRGNDSQVRKNTEQRRIVDRKIRSRR